MVLKLTEGFGLMEASVMEFEDTDLNGQWAVMTRQGVVMRMIDCCEKTEGEEVVFVSPVFSAFDLLKPSSGTFALHLYCWDDLDHPSVVQEEVCSA